LTFDYGSAAPDDRRSNRTRQRLTTPRRRFALLRATARPQGPRPILTLIDRRDASRIASDSEGFATARESASAPTISATTDEARVFASVRPSSEIRFAIELVRRFNPAVKFARAGAGSRA